MNIFEKLKTFFIGGARNLNDKRLFYNLSLIAVFAWVGLGADGLSSSSYGPQEAFYALQGHPYLGILIGIATAITVMVIGTSYSQIVELFPMGGGGYIVASKLLSPNVGMVSGCALLIDYVLTIVVSVSSGADAVFSFLPAEWYPYRLSFAVALLFVLIILNLRGVKESVLILAPIFIVFVITHIFAILYALITHMGDMSGVVRATAADINITRSQIGLIGLAVLLLKAYSMGAGTYTGIEAVSNSMSILRDPKVKTAKTTMNYMMISLSICAMGLMVAYALYRVNFQEGKTLNAVLYETMTANWGKGLSGSFVLIIMISEAALLFVAAQTGFLGGPRVLANMANDRWFPTRFNMLSDRFVTQNGVILMGGASLILMLLTKGSVRLLVVFYSINVFITFVLSQLGMIKHWWNSRRKLKGWFKKYLINLIGFVMTVFILLSIIIIKFHQGGWITLCITTLLVLLAFGIKKHYLNTKKLLHRLNDLVSVVNATIEKAGNKIKKPRIKYNTKDKTAVLLVNGFNGLGLHTLFNIFKLFGDVYKNFIFVSIGVVDAANFKGTEEFEKLQNDIKKDLDKYVKYINASGYHAEGIQAMGTDVIAEIDKIAPEVLKKYPKSIFFGGQLVFPKEVIIARWLHNYTVFAIQKQLYYKGIPFIILPIRV